MSQDNKKKEQQYKLNYFDILMGILFPKRGKPAPKAPPSAAPKPTPAPQPISPGAAQKPAQTAAPLPPPPASTLGSSPRPAAQPSSPAATGQTGASAAQPIQAQKTAPKSPATARRLTLRRDKLAPAFFNIAGILSFIVNIILIVILVILARELFTLKALVGDYLLGGLYDNFKLMDAAHIRTQITVEETIPIQFDLPISQQTTVVLTENTVIYNAIVGVLSVPTTVTLPAGTELPIQLNMTVPVQTTIPVKLNVPVDIPLNETELHPPFIGLQEVVRPFNELLQPEIKTPADMPCGILSPFCNNFFITR